MNFTADTDCVGQLERMRHVEELLPEICSLDCGSFNYAEGNYVYISTPGMLRLGAKRLQTLGVKPELEVFDLGPRGVCQTIAGRGVIGQSSPLPGLPGYSLGGGGRYEKLPYHGGSTASGE